MRFVPHWLVAIFAGLSICSLAAAQAAPAAQSAAPAPAASATSPEQAARSEAIQQFIEKNFGPDLKYDPAFAPFVGDFDGDGEEDVILIARGKNVMGAEGQFQYRVQDPYDAYYGFGNARIMAQYTTGGPQERHFLVVHGWKLQTPKAKFVLVNVPFEQAAMSHATLKKKMVSAITTHEAAGLSALIFFDGKKYRWEPIGMD
ncbi:MAG TPA: hypothetical protein VEG30_03055 [Terriglobales bacterium]|nr:hypothetical protein [Terriglobales bacterium]